jgi:hypothetical protein
MAKKTHLRRDTSERLGDLLDQSLSRLELASQLQAYGIWPVWNEVVGKPVARNAQPEKIRNGTLFVKVSSPVWMQQLQFMKELIAEKLNQRLRAQVVKNIFFVVGPLVPTDTEPEVEAVKTTEPSAGLTMDEGFLDSLRDPEMRQAFRTLLRSYARRKSGRSKR